MGGRAITEPLALTTDYVSIDGRYTDANGNPYASVAAAETALGRKMNQYTVGLTVLVKESGWTEAKEYWVQPKGTTPETYGLVEKGGKDLTKALTLSGEQKHNASANINDRAAVVDIETDVVESKGYKVLNPAFSFAEQVENVVENDVIVVDNSNIIFEVRDKFDLDGGTIVIPNGCVLRFNGGMVANGTLNFGNCTIDSPLVPIFDGITITNASTSQHIHVKWFGMSNTSTNNSAIFSMVVNAFKNVIVDDGSYPMEAGVTISGGSGTGIKTIVGFESKYPYRPSLNFGTLNGVALTLARNCIIQGIHLSGTKGTWDSTEAKYTDGTVGVLVQVSSVIENCGFSNCMVGISFAGYNTVYSFVNRCLFESCGNYGIYQYSYAMTTPLTTNATHITNNYFVNIGYNAGSSSAALAEPTTKTTSGIGLYIKAGAGNSYTGNVFEYCSGCGCLIDTPTVTGSGSERRESLYKGLVFTNNYFECNKYANLLILMNQSANFYINDIFIAGNNFSDAGKTLPADALPWRRIALFSTYYSSIITDHQIYIQGLETLRSNFIKDGVIDTKYLTYSPILPADVVTYSNPEISIAKAKNQELDFRIPLEQGFYKLYINMKSFIQDKVVFSINYHIYDANNTSIENGPINASFVSQTTSTTYANRDILVYWGARSNKYFYIPQGGYFRFDGFYIGNNTNTADNNGVCINKIKFVKIESGNSTLRESFAGTIPTNYPYYDTTLKKKLLYNGSKWVDDDGFTAAKSSGATADRPTLASTDVGYRYFDTTLGKNIYWNGTAWVDSNGETVGLQVSDTSILISAAADSSKTVLVYYGGSTAPTITVLNADDTANTWLTAALVDNTLTLTAAANTAPAPRGAKVLVTLGDELVIINVIQTQTVSNE